MSRFTARPPLTLLAVLLTVLLSTASAVAQSYYGTLKGSVMDPQGGMIPHAQITLTDTSTHIARKAETNSSGEYVFNAVDPGKFTLTIVADNFATQSLNGISVATQQNVVKDVTLTLGGAAQTVEVTAEQPLIDVGSASNGQVFDQQKLQDLPNLGRNPFLLTKLNNNVTTTGDPRFNRFQDQSGSSAISVSGGPINGNNYEVDGVPITDFSNRAVIIPSVDAVQEMKIQTNTYDAEMGRTGGGNFNTLLKSGTNRLHGNLLGTTRQTNWSANTWNNNINKGARPNITQYTYEGSIGGPLWKDHTFFWLTEEGYRQRSPLAGNYFLPSAAERQGIFTGNARTIYDPATTDASGNRTPFTNNVIPSARINPVAKRILDSGAIPACESSAGCTVQAFAPSATNFRPTDLLGDRADEFIGKIDQKITNKWTANVSYMHYGSKEPGGNPLGSFAGTSGSYLLYRKVDATTANTVYTINPSTVATVGFGFNRFPNNTLDLTSNYDLGTNLGFTGPYASQTQKKAFPGITFTQINLPVGTNNSGPATFYSRNFVAGIQKSLGKHSIKFGYVYRSISVDFTNISSSNGSFVFNNTFTSQNPTPSTRVGGIDFADFLLGFPTSGSVQVVTPLHLNVPYHALYIQDDYRLTNRLSINVGLRYEYEQGIHERDNKYAVGFDRTVINPISATSGVTTRGGIRFAGQNGYGSTTGTTNPYKFAPRFGAVFALNNKTVVRGGFGVFYAPIYYSTSASLAPGYAATTSYVASTTGNNFTPSGLTTGGWQNPYPTFNQPVGNTLGYSQGIGDALTTVDQNRRSPAVMQYSFDVERQLPYGMAVQIGYVGSRGRNLLPGNGTTYNLNQIDMNAIPYGQGACPSNSGNLAPATFLATTFANPYYNKGGTGVIGSSSVAASQLCKPFPEFSTVNIQPSNSHSLYNSGIAKLQKNMSNGLSLVTAITWSSNWDSTFGQSSALNTGNNGPADIYNLEKEYSRAINNMPLRYTFGGNYALPFGRGKALLSSNKWLDMIVGGWVINSTFVAQSGSPVLVRQTTNGNAAFGTAVQRPDLLQGVNPCTDGPVQQRLGTTLNGVAYKSFLNPAAFAVAPAGRNGTAPRTLPGCAGPAYRNVDASIFKQFKTWEKATFEFRAEVNNVTNTPQFALNSAGLQFSTTSTTSNFGTVNTNAINFPRLISLGGKIIF